MKSMRTRLLLTLLCLAPSLLPAQDTQRGPDGGTTYRVTGVELLAIPNKPFQASTQTDWTRTLADGTTLKVRLNATLARSSDGRIYRERRSFVPAGSSDQSRLNNILLYDPAARTQTICFMATHRCLITAWRPRLSFTAAPAGASANGASYLARENLGSNTIEDLEVTGTRETLTLNPGVIGNERPLVSTREFWYSPELETNLAVTRNDPREGLQVIRLSNVSRSEPEAQLFEVPSGFTVEDTRRTRLPRPQPETQSEP
jgi:hypothetical protein